MNSYYTNKIEGQHTLPREVEAALHAQFSSDADVRRRRNELLAAAREVFAVPAEHVALKTRERGKGGKQRE